MSRPRIQQEVPEVCPKCGEPVKSTYDAPYQEYPGASYSGGGWSVACTNDNCGWDDWIRNVDDGFEPQENCRGW